MKILKHIAIIIIALIAILLLGYLVFQKIIPDNLWGKKIEVRGDKDIVGKTEEIIELPIIVDTKGKCINAFEIFLKFDKEAIEIISINTDQSFVELWISGQPSFSNESGEIIFAGGLPTPGFSGKGEIGILKIKLKNSGVSTIKFKDDSRLLLNDGNGTGADAIFRDIKVNIK